MNPKSPKKKGQLLHFRRRLRERYKLDINSKGIARVIKDIQRNRASCLVEKSNRVSVWRVEIQKTFVVVVYDKKRQSLVTALKRYMVR